MKLVFFLTVLIGLANSVLSKAEVCAELLRQNGYSSNYNETIGHAIHSMTVQGLQMFNPKATVKNNVPTVNMDRHSDMKVVRFAPEDRLQQDFDTPSMNTIDKILSNIGMDNDGLGSYWSPVERIVHKFHMLDVWASIKNVFDSQTIVDPPQDDVCDCLLDVGNNGIYDAVAWISNHYDSAPLFTLLNRPIPKLTDAGSWQVWKKRLLWYYNYDNLNDAANYIYCATKDF